MMALVTADGSVAFSSDQTTLPVLSKAETVQRLKLHRHEQKNYLISVASSRSYQQYYGPGWQVQMWTPLDTLTQTSTLPATDNTLAETGLFPALSAIKLESMQVNDELSLIVLNGEIAAARKHAIEFIPVLNAIRGIGQDIYQVFSSSIDELAATIMHSQLLELTTLAELAADIMDRNLYERANDCRWWAQNASFRQALAQPNITDAQRQALAQQLAYINGLYTVYQTIYLYDARLQLVACFTDASGRVISAVNAKWLAGTLLPLPAELYHQALQQALTRQCELGGQRYLVAIAPTKGYREYKTSDGYQNQLFACLLLRM